MAARLSPTAGLLALALAGALAGCEAPGKGGTASRTSQAGTPEPAPPAVVVAAPPPAPVHTSDRGDRLARPSPIGQLAPEEAPTAPGPAPSTTPAPSR
jgi:hypothetical protein